MARDRPRSIDDEIVPKSGGKLHGTIRGIAANIIAGQESVERQCGVIPSKDAHLCTDSVASLNHGYNSELRCIDSDRNESGAEKTHNETDQGWCESNSRQIQSHHDRPWSVCSVAPCSTRVI